MNRNSWFYPLNIIDLRAISLSLLIAVITTFPIFAFSQEKHSETSFSCELTEDVHCEITDPYGIARIQVNAEIERSASFEVYDQRYLDCSTQATVQWAASLPNAIVTVTTCYGPDLTYYHTFGDVKGTPFMSNSYRVSFEDTNSDGNTEARYSALGKTDPKGSFDNVDGDKAGVAKCYNSNICTRLAAWCDRNNGVGTCYEDHCECAVPDK